MQIIPDAEVLLSCGCGHSSIIVLTGDVLFPEIKRRARCSACGRRDVISATRMSPTNDRPRLGEYIIGEDGVRRRVEAGERPKPHKVWPY